MLCQYFLLAVAVLQYAELSEPHGAPAVERTGAQPAPRYELGNGGFQVVVLHNAIPPMQHVHVFAIVSEDDLRSVIVLCERAL